MYFLFCSHTSELTTLATNAIDLRFECESKSWNETFVGMTVSVDVAGRLPLVSNVDSTVPMMKALMVWNQLLTVYDQEIVDNDSIILTVAADAVVDDDDDGDDCCC